jgi:putative FmdB family regulatory protein
MPTYVYECRTCGVVKEVQQRITEDPLKDCDCGALGQLRRVIQPVGIAFKGSGFYVNDGAGKAAPAKQVESKPAEPAAPAAPATPATPAAE